jgi:hypothetical protein
MERATKRMKTFTTQLFPVHVREMPMNFTTMAASQNTTSMQLRMALALRLLHFVNRAVCSLSSW